MHIIAKQNVKTVEFVNRINIIKEEAMYIINRKQLTCDKNLN